ncbi:hypothetical protein SEA_LILMARTIN_242 [Streptomyces phage LilMartin]|nr:hypothetical protein SEA_LILMARTIN_242 [Streptomyces phage LilMartin]UVK61297.1 hypothetical protein SEA_ANGELA_246 [Streptomyces phage Angela]
MEKLAKEFKKVFDDKDYQWMIGGVLTSPSEQDILDTLKQMAERISKEPDGTWMELGHFIFIKTGGLIDVYLHHETIKEQNEQPNTESVPETP